MLQGKPHSLIKIFILILNLIDEQWGTERDMASKKNKQKKTKLWDVWCFCQFLRKTPGTTGQEGLLTFPPTSNVVFRMFVQIPCLAEIWVTVYWLLYSFSKKKSDSWPKSVKWSQEISAYMPMEKTCCLEDK